MLFNQQPEFITNDPRYDPNHDIGWTPEFQYDRYSAWFQDVELEGKTVLDLGCAGAAVGAYVLHRGAKTYTGIEISNPIAVMARDNLARYYPQQSWAVEHAVAEDWIQGFDRRYDVAVVAGVMHGVTDMLNFLKRLAEIADTILIECFHPNMTVIPNAITRLYTLAPTPEEKQEIARLAAWIEHEQPYIEINPQGKMVLDDQHATASGIMKLAPSMGALAVILDRLGFTPDYRPYHRLAKQHGKYFGRGRRFAMAFRRTHAAGAMSFAELRESGEMKVISWGQPTETQRDGI